MCFRLPRDIPDTFRASCTDDVMTAVPGLPFDVSTWDVQVLFLRPHSTRTTSFHAMTDAIPPPRIGDATCTSICRLVECRQTAGFDLHPHRQGLGIWLSSAALSRGLVSSCLPLCQLDCVLPCSMAPPRCPRSRCSVSFTCSLVYTKRSLSLVRRDYMYLANRQ